jgi:hypothetical protein
MRKEEKRGKVRKASHQATMVPPSTEQRKRTKELKKATLTKTNKSILALLASFSSALFHCLWISPYK